MIINKFYEKLYKELINKLESDYILIPNTPENNFIQYYFQLYIKAVLHRSTALNFLMKAKIEF